jgi:hypothetical protein
MPRTYTPSRRKRYRPQAIEPTKGGGIVIDVLFGGMMLAMLFSILYALSLVQ